MLRMISAADTGSTSSNSSIILIMMSSALDPSIFERVTLFVFVHSLDSDALWDPLRAHEEVALSAIVCFPEVGTEVDNLQQRNKTTVTEAGCDI